MEESLPTRRLRETGGQIDSLRPTLEIYLVDATIQENGTVTYELNEAPTVKIYRENHPIKDPAHFSKYLYTVNTTDTHGSTNAIIDETASEKSAEIGGHLGLLISSITHALYRHGELIKALESGDIDQFNETYEERLARENDQIGALLRAYMSGFTSETALVPLVSVPTAISRLSPREQDAIRIFYGSGQEGKKLKDLAAELGVSPTRARELVQRALAKLKFSLLPHNNE